MLFSSFIFIYFFNFINLSYSLNINSTIAAFNSCSNSILLVRFGSIPLSDYNKTINDFNITIPDDIDSTIYINQTVYNPQLIYLPIGRSRRLYFSYSPIYYEMFDYNGLVVSSVINIVNKNINGIGYVNYPNVGCQLFEYIPTDTSLSSKSIIVYVNGGLQDKNAYVGSIHQGFVPPKPDTSLTIHNTASTYYYYTQIIFCNKSCVSSGTGNAYIPIGSAIFFFNTYISNTSSTVFAALTGESYLSFNWCTYDCDYYYDDDWDLDVGPSDGVIAGIVCGTVGGVCLICCCIGYILYRLRLKCCPIKQPNLLLETTPQYIIPVPAWMIKSTDPVITDTNNSKDLANNAI